MCMYSAPSGLMMNNSDAEPLPPTTHKWLRRSKHKKKRPLASFAAYFRRYVA